MEPIISALPVIISLIILEGLLSVDNAMLISAMVDHLPDAQKKRALWYGMAGAYVFRGLALLFVSFLIANPWIKIMGAGYLVYLMFKHLGVAEDGETDAHQAKKAGFWGTVMAVELADLAFSIDNVIAAVAMSPKLWVVIVGVFIGIAAMRFVAGIFVNLMKKYPELKAIAYLLVGYVGLQLLAEVIWHVHVTELVKLGAILGIMVVGIVYARVKILQTVFGPVVRWVQEGLGNVAELVDWAFKPLTATASVLFSLGKRVFKRSGKDDDEGGADKK